MFALCENGKETPYGLVVTSKLALIPILLSHLYKSCYDVSVIRVNSYCPFSKSGLSFLNFVIPINWKFEECSWFLFILLFIILLFLFNKYIISS